MLKLENTWPRTEASLVTILCERGRKEEGKAKRLEIMIQKTPG